MAVVSVADAIKIDKERTEKMGSRNSIHGGSHQLDSEKSELLKRLDDMKKAIDGYREYK